MSRTGVRENAALEDDEINLVETGKVDQCAVLFPKTRGLLLRRRSLDEDEEISGLCGEMAEDPFLPRPKG